MFILVYLLIFVLGLSVGSFMNVCIYRIPKGESVVTPPSHCTACGKRLKPMDLIPVFSYIFNKGKCKYCGDKISIRYPAVELLTGIVFLLLFRRYELDIYFIFAAYIMSILIAVFFIDIDHKIIPDGLVLAGIAGGFLLFIYNIFFPVDIFISRAWWNPLVGAVTGSGFLFAAALAGSIIYKSDEALGMGDVKIFIPIGMFLGWRVCIVALILAILAGGIYSIAVLVLRIKKKKDIIPFGPFIVIAAFTALMAGKELYLWYTGMYVFGL